MYPSFGLLVLFWPFTQISVDNISSLLLFLLCYKSLTNIFSSLALVKLFCSLLLSLCIHHQHFLILFAVCTCIFHWFYPILDIIFEERDIMYPYSYSYSHHHFLPCFHCHPHAYIRMVLLFFTHYMTLFEYNSSLAF